MDVYSDSVDDGDEDAPEILADPVENMELIAVVHADDELEEDAGVEEKETAPPEALRRCSSVTTRRLMLRGVPGRVARHERHGHLVRARARWQAVRGERRRRRNAHGEVLVGDVLMETSTVEFRERCSPRGTTPRTVLRREHGGDEEVRRHAHDEDVQGLRAERCDRRRGGNERRGGRKRREVGAARMAGASARR